MGIVRKPESLRDTIIQAYQKVAITSFVTATVTFKCKFITENNFIQDFKYVSFCVIVSAKPKKSRE